MIAVSLVFCTEDGDECTRKGNITTETMATMGGSWEGGAGGRKESKEGNRKERGEGGRRGGEKEEETETEGGWTVCTLGRVKYAHMNVEL